MQGVLIGITVHSQPQRLRATLASLASDSTSARVLLLPDGPDEETRRALEELHDLPQLPADSPQGTAACFNRLIHFEDAEYYLLLESGAIPAPGWLDRLLGAFRQFPSCGVAGPSTNLSWNEQGIFSCKDDTFEVVLAAGRNAARRFGTTCRSLQPLHSLSDFCYMVRRDVIAAVGDADEGYGTGPCWEMDYNIRAQRAGFLGLWVCGAYVHRCPRSPRQLRDEAEGFPASKQRYQDKFCGLRLRGLKHDYRQHCRGDACPEFAPAKLITIRPLSEPQPLNPPPAKEVAAPCVVTLPKPPEATNGSAPDATSPLVSCIMPTYNRRKFLPEALRCFLAQDYPNLELIVADDGSDAISDLLPDDPRIRYFRLSSKLTVGAKRNFACQHANGDFIAHWDDDDWYPPSRIRRQVTALTNSTFQVCGTTTMYYRHLAQNQAYRYTYRGPSCQWMGALMYRKQAWERSPFDAIQIGEDVRFIGRIPTAARHDLLDPGLSIGAIHDANASPKITNGPFWTPERMENVLAILGNAGAEASPSVPMISCIMPTYNRRSFIPLTLECFRAQTYPNKELIVVDDGTDAVGDLLELEAGVRYIRVPPRRTIGAKRNLACEQSRGEFIAHWDDDDWYAPERLQVQCEPLLADAADITGLTNRFVLEMPAGQFWTTSERLHGRMFMGDVHGGTLVYRRNILRNQLRYPEINLAEDAGFIQQAMRCNKKLVRLENKGVFVYLRHNRNAWQFQTGKFIDPAGWSPTTAPCGFSSQLLDSYRRAAEFAGCRNVAV